MRARLEGERAASPAKALHLSTSSLVRHALLCLLFSLFVGINSVLAHIHKDKCTSFSVGIVKSGKCSIAARRNVQDRCGS